MAGSLVNCNVAFADDDELDNKLAYNTVEVSDNEIVFNGVTQSYDGSEYTFTAGSSSGEGDIAWNKITINGGRFTLYVNGGSYTGSLIGNEFILNGGRLTLSVNDALSFGGTVRGNILRISGGEFANSYLYLPLVTATDNTVEITGNADLSNVYLYGGILGDVDSASGNTLNVNAVGLTARNIYDFDSLNFYLPVSAQNGDTALTLTEGSTDISGRTITAVVAGGTGLTTGDKINLLVNGNGLDTTNTTLDGRFAEGVTLTYDADLAATDNGLELTLGASRVEEQTRALNQGAIVSSGEIVRATDRIINALQVEDFEPGGEDSNANANLMMISNSWGIFADAGGGKIRTKTGSGSYVDSRGKGMNLGFARTLADPEGSSFVIAPVFDYGKTSYDSYLRDGTHGKGDAKHFLGGLFFRQMNRNGFYWEGSFRGGKAETDFTSHDFKMGSQNIGVYYNDSAPAFAGHVRFGKLQRLDRNNLLHVYGLYSHSHVNSMDTKISTGERYDFDSVDSGTFQAGYRLTTRTSPISNIYTGLAFQYQFNGSTSATYRGYTTPKAEVKGSTGILELGWQIRPRKSNPWALNININGRIGLQKGVSASAGVRKAF